MNNTNVKVGDWVISLISGIDVTKGKQYKIIKTDGIIYPCHFIDDADDVNYFKDGEFALYKVSPDNSQLVVGKTYTSRNGDKWEAMTYLDEERNFIWGKSSVSLAAYVWNKDGTSVSFAHNMDYNIDLGPIVVEGVAVCGGSLWVGDYQSPHVSNMTVTTIDGEPDWTTLKVLNGALLL